MQKITKNGQTVQKIYQFEESSDLIGRELLSCQIWAKWDISRKIRLRYFFTSMDLQLHAKYQKKLMNQFREK